MSRTGRRVVLLALGTLLACGVLTAAVSLSARAPAAVVEARPDPSNVKLTLKIKDPDSGLSVAIEKRIPKGTNGLKAIKELVVLKTRRYVGMGEFITSFCGVDTTSGKFWSLHVDGELSQVGIDSITLDHDTLIEWKLQDQ